VLCALAAVIAFTTTKGQELLELARSAKKEIQRVVWPTRPETIQTTGIVLVAVLVVGLMLWMIDTLLGWAMSGVIG
jgi:preprotein translocase subunit SecE